MVFLNLVRLYVFVADSKDVHKQKLFEYVQHGHTYRCYVDIFNENDDEINIIEVKATTNSKYLLKTNKDGKLDGYCFSEKRGAEKHPMFVREGNIWTLNHAGCKANADLEKNFEQKRRALLDRYSDLGKYPHDLAFQKYVIEHSLRKAGDNRKVNYYLAVLNSEYVYDGAKDAEGKPLAMAGFPYHALDTYLPKLIRAGERVAICDQLEAPKRATEEISPSKVENPQQEQNNSSGIHR